MNKPKPRICKACKVSYKNGDGHRSRVHCPDCCFTMKEQTENIKSMTLEQLTENFSVVGKHPSWKFAHVRGMNRSWNSDLRKLPCANCGYSKHVELAHRKPLNSFSPTTTLGEVNSRENNVQLCPNCHWEFDNDLLSI